MSRADRTEVFEHMPIPRAVGRQIIPAIASQMIALVYNLADTYFVGMLDDPKETAAITVVYSSFVMLTAISNLFGVGGASALSRALGKKDTEAAKGIAALSFWGGLGCAVLFSLLFLLFARPILMLCGAGPEIFDTAYRYALWVVVIGGPGTILNTLLSNLVRAEGKAAAVDRRGAYGEAKFHGTGETEPSGGGRNPASFRPSGGRVPGDGNRYRSSGMVRGGRLSGAAGTLGYWISYPAFFWPKPFMDAPEAKKTVRASACLLPYLGECAVRTAAWLSGRFLP